jgi:hypothetical protein
MIFAASQVARHEDAPLQSIFRQNAASRASAKTSKRFLAEHLFAESAVGSIDVRVLIGLVWLDVPPR